MDMHKLRFKVLRTLGLRQKNITKSDFATCLDKKFFFIHVPKTAGKSLRISLFGQENGARHCSAGYLKSRYPDLWNDFFTFCFVRNPYDRLYSAYRYLKNGGNLQERDLNFQTKVLGNIESFEEFVCDWLNKDRLYAYHHLLPQHEFIYHKNECLVEYIGRFEELREGYDYIRKKLSLRNNLPHTNRSRENTPTHFSTLYSLEMSRKVARFYQDDFRLFGYSPCLDDCRKSP